jgi:hypothetical protein
MEREISSVHERIEQMAAQQKDLNNKVQFATIQLELNEEYRAELEPPALSIRSDVRNALVDGIRSATDSTVGIALFLLRYGPTFLIWCVVATPFVLVLWRFRFRIVRR